MVTKDYRIIDEDIVKTINKEAKELTEELKIADRVESHSEAPAFVTIKDHKKDFKTDPKCRLINPAKSQIGQISKKILQENNSKLREKLNLKQWQSTNQVLKWFAEIKDKKQKTFLQLDIVEFYPSISEELLQKAFNFAEQQGLPFTEQQKEIILNTH